MALAVAQATGAPNANNVAFGSSTTAGSLVAALGHTFATATYAAGDTTDSKSNTYTLDVSNPGGGGATPGVGIWANNGGTRGASHTVTCAPALNISVIEVTGQATSSALDATTAATATDATSPFTVTSAAAITGNQVAIYGVTIDSASGNVAWGQPAGYSVIFSWGDSANLVSDSAYKINETGTPAPGATWTGTLAAGGGHEVFATYKEAGPIVALDSSSAGSAEINDATSLTWTQTITDVDTAKLATVVAVTSEVSGGTPTGLTATFAGQAMTLVGSVLVTGGTFMKAWAFALPLGAMSTGVKTIVVSYVGTGTVDAIYGWSRAWKSVNQATPTRNFTSVNNGTTTHPTLAITTQSGNATVGGVVAALAITGSHTGEGTQDATAFNNFVGAGASGAASHGLSTGVSQTLGFDITSAAAAMVGFDIVAGVATASTTPGGSPTRDRDRRAVRGISTRDRLAVRGHDRQQRSQFELYRPASIFGNVTLSRAISDTANGTDALTRSLVLARSVNDTAAGSDGLTGTLVQTRAITDTASGTDVVTRLLVEARSITDTGSGTDAPVRVLVDTRAITDTAAGTDAVTRTRVSTRAISDSAGGTDAVSRTLVQTRSISDSAPASDIAVAGALQRPITDVASGTDAVTRTATFSRSLTDTAAGTDAATRTDVQVRAVTDSANGTDALTRTLIETRSITDAAAGTDALTRTRVSTRSLTDNAPASDSLTRSLAEPRTLTDTAAGSDAVARSAVYARSISDTAAGTDAVTRTRSLTRSISDSANGTDSVTTRTLVQARSISDSAPTAETIVSSKGPTRFINDNAPALDAVTRTSTRTRALTEAVVGTDATTGVVSRTRSLSDAAGGTDILTRTLGESRSISDSAPASDATTRAPVIVRGVGDNAFASDTVTRTVRTNRAIGDSAPAVDSARKVLLVFITDRAGGTDAAVAIFVPTTVSIRVTRRAASFMSAMSPSGQRTAPRVQRTDEAS